MSLKEISLSTRFVSCESTTGKLHLRKAGEVAPFYWRSICGKWMVADRPDVDVSHFAANERNELCAKCIYYYKTHAARVRVEKLRQRAKGNR